MNVLRDNTIRTTRFSTKRNKIKVVFLGDIHFGASPCLEEDFLKLVDKIEKTRNLLWVGLGDYMEIATKKSPGKSLYQQVHSPNDQYYVIRKEFSRISRKCLGLHPGNHENRLVKDFNFCMTFHLAEDLGVSYLTSHATHIINVNGVERDIVTTHGRTGATTEEGKRRAAKKLLNIHKADIYAYAHTHLLDTFPKRYYSRGEPQDVYFALTGSFMDYLDSYGEEAEYEPLFPGYVVAEITKQKVKMHEEWLI